MSHGLTEQVGVSLTADQALQERWPHQSNASHATSQVATHSNHERGTNLSARRLRRGKQLNSLLQAADPHGTKLNSSHLRTSPDNSSPPQSVLPQALAQPTNAAYGPSTGSQQLHSLGCNGTSSPDASPQPHVATGAMQSLDLLSELSPCAAAVDPQDTWVLAACSDAKLMATHYPSLYTAGSQDAVGSIEVDDLANLKHHDFSRPRADALAPLDLLAVLDAGTAVDDTASPVATNTPTDEVGGVHYPPGSGVTSLTNAQDGASMHACFLHAPASAAAGSDSSSDLDEGCEHAPAAADSDSSSEFDVSFEAECERVRSSLCIALQ